MKSNLIVFQLIMFQAETSATAPMNPESQMQQQLHQQNQQQQMQSKIFFRKLIFTYCNGCRVVIILNTLLCMDYFLGMYEGFRGHMVTAHSTDWMGRILHLT